MNYFGPSYFAADIPLCCICFKELTCPVKLPCGHKFDIDCLGNCFIQKPVCPLDQTSFKAYQVKYDISTIASVNAKFEFKITLGRAVDPVYLNLDIKVERLRNLIAKIISRGESNWINAFFLPSKNEDSEKIDPRELTLSIIHNAGNQLLKPGKTLFHYNLLPLHIIKIAVIRQQTNLGVASRANSEITEFLTKLD